MSESRDESADTAASGGAAGPSDGAAPRDGRVAAPGEAAPRRRGPRRAVRRGTEREAVLGVSADERPAGWGEGADGGPGSSDGGHGSNDDQLRRDVPPHWG
ncbi:hypothetical protein [Promicromonospora sp. NPDC090134]|uniref:hypothetical protein n=1 Tax=Promicromonospora sp. NPDC090134 TaxID=3364408 RepID=UPI0037F8153C